MQSKKETLPFDMAKLSPKKEGKIIAYLDHTLIIVLTDFLFLNFNIKST
jgi:hypothetical protein